MNPGGRRGGLVSVLCVLQWIHPIMSLVDKGGYKVIWVVLAKIRILRTDLRFSIFSDIGS